MVPFLGSSHPLALANCISLEVCSPWLVYMYFPVCTLYSTLCGKVCVGENVGKFCKLKALDKFVL